MYTMWAKCRVFLNVKAGGTNYVQNGTIRLQNYQRYSLKPQNVLSPVGLS
jgi:hypothetical protein